MNEKGLSVAILELEKSPTFQISTKKSLTTTMMVRAVLDKASTLDEAIKIFKTCDMRDLLVGGCTYHYQISDANGNSAVIEYINNKMNIIYPEKKNGNKVNFVCATNYFLTKGVDDPDGMGHERAEIVNAKLTETKGLLGETAAMNLLQKTSMKDADLHGYICSTLWSTVFNSQKLTADYCFNNDYENVYHFSIDEPQKIQ